MALDDVTLICRRCVLLLIPMYRIVYFKKKYWQSTKSCFVLVLIPHPILFDVIFFFSKLVVGRNGDVDVSRRMYRNHRQLLGMKGLLIDILLYWTLHTVWWKYQIFLRFKVKRKKRGYTLKDFHRSLISLNHLTTTDPLC